MITLAPYYWNRIQDQKEALREAEERITSLAEQLDAAQRKIAVLKREATKAEQKNVLS